MEKLNVTVYALQNETKSYILAQKINVNKLLSIDEPYECEDC